MKGHLKRRGGSWAIVIDDKESGSRKRRWVTVHARNRKEAEQERIRVMREQQLGLLTDSRGLTVDKLLVQGLEDQHSRVGTRSWERYETITRKYLRPSLGAIRLSELRPRSIQEFYTRSLAAGMTAHVLRYCHVSLHSALRYAEKLQMVARNPVNPVEPPRAAKADVRG